MTYGRWKNKTISERDVIEMFRSGKYSIIQLAKYFGCDRVKVIRPILAKEFSEREIFTLGREVANSRKAQFHPFYKPIPEQEVVSRYLAGESRAVLAKSCQVSEDKIQRTLKRYLMAEQIKANRYRMMGAHFAGKTNKLKGRMFTEEQRKKYIGIFPKGNKHHFWRGGISSEDWLFMASGEWKQTRRQVFKRDGKFCRICFSMEMVMVHHLIPRGLDKERVLWLDPDNCITVCRGCHSAVEPRGWKSIPTAVEVVHYYGGHGITVSFDLAITLIRKVSKQKTIQQLLEAKG